MVEITHAVSPETHSAQRLLKGAQDLCVGWEFYEGGYMKNGNKLLVCLSLLAGLFIWSGCGSNSTSTGTCSSGQYQSQSYGCITSCSTCGSGQCGLVNNVCQYAPASSTSGSLGTCPSNYDGYQMVAGTVYYMGQNVPACCAVGYPQTTQYCLPASQLSGSQYGGGSGNCQPGYYWNGSTCVP